VALAPCPDKPNCVCSTAPADDPHAVAPLPLPLGVDALALVRRVVSTLPRTTEVGADATSVHFTCTTAVLRFVDDLQFEVDEDAGVVHVRSASRLGYSDLGVNRERVEQLRQAWLAALPS